MKDAHPADLQSLGKYIKNTFFIITQQLENYMIMTFLSGYVALHLSPVKNHKNNFNMRNFISTLSAAALLGVLHAGLTSCQPETCTLCEKEVEEGKPSTLTLSLVPVTSTRSTLSQTQEQDNIINTLDIFIFRKGDPASAGYHKLDTYRRFEGGSLSDIEISTTTGEKLICVIANSNIGTYTGITTLETFRSMTALLKDETCGDFTMYGETEQTLGITTSVAVSVSRLVSRICVTSVRTDFAGGPYAGMRLSNCRMFLVNAHAEKYLHDGSSPAVPLILNQGGLIGDDVNSTAEAGLLMDNIPDVIGDEGYTSPHYFYCYSNETDDIPASTKLVLQADLDGVTYYYPIPVNQAGYGLTEPDEETVSGISGNCVYSYGITVTRPGSLDPDTPLVPGTLELSLNVNAWDVIPHFDKVF